MFSAAVLEVPAILSRRNALVGQPSYAADPRDLIRELDAARVALGERMYAAGIDDGETMGLIALVEVAARDAFGTAARYLRTERGRLIRRLADAALENDAPLPGADAELARAWAAQTACEWAGLLN